MWALPFVIENLVETSLVLLLFFFFNLILHASKISHIVCIEYLIESNTRVRMFVKPALMMTDAIIFTFLK